MTTYKEAGVDLDLGNEASKILYNAAKLTWENRKGRLGEVVELFSDFSGIRGSDIGGLPKGTFTNLGFDGVGTKIEIAERMEKHDTVAYDLFAMVCDDAVRFGAEPVMVGSVLDVNSLDGNIDYLRQMAKGYVDAAREAGVAVVNGEIAELGARVRGYGDFNYNWAAGAVWFMHRSKAITGLEIKLGDHLIGFRENGFRSNGLSLTRKILENHFGENWHEVLWEDGKTLGEMVLTPSIIYAKAIVDMLGGYDANVPPKVKIHGIAHITGGGIPEKLGRILKSTGFGAVIDEPFEPPRFMDYVQYLGNVSDEEACRTWNRGQGMIVITPEPEKVVQVAELHGINAQWMGEITEKPGIIIKNVNAFSNGGYLSFS